MALWTDSERNEASALMARVAREAGDALARLHATGISAEWKPDGSPVSIADRAAEAIVERGLTAAFPGIPIVSEENSASHAAGAPERFLLVDPLDGTRAFLKGRPDFCVLIALIENGVPIASAIDAPKRGMAYRAGAQAWATSLEPIGGEEIALHSSDSSRRNIAIISMHHAGEASRRICASLGVDTILTENSALKFARLAEGEADVYPRAGTTMQWDVAAGDALLRSLGGGVNDLSGKPLRYGALDGDWEVPGFVAWRRLDRSTKN